MPSPEVIKTIAFAFSQVERLSRSESSDVAHETLQTFADLFRQARKLRFWNKRLQNVSEPFSIPNLAAQVPILTRSEIQDSRGELRIRLPATDRRQYHISRTSGSTGKPVEVMKFAPSQRIQSAVVSLVIAKWAKLDVSKNYARIRNAKDESSSPTWGFPYPMIGKTGESHTFSITTRGAEGVLQALVDNQVNYIHSNMTALRAVALAYRDSQLFGKLNLELALTWSEKVTQDDRDIIREYLGVEIWDSYSSEELGAIALQCPDNQHLHVLPFFTHVEIIDDQGKPCEIGQPGKVVATSLHNYSQPMIRYELGDIATFQEQCPVLPNFPVINPEVTRTRDEYVTGSGQKVFPIFAKARFLKYKGLKDYQVILFADTILFMYSSIAPLTREQQVEVTEDVGKSFMFDHPVEVLRLDQEQLFSHWKRKVFYKSAKPMFDIAEFSSLDLEDLL